MKIIAPKFYKSFHCIADKCPHSCCIGWEIDIDRATLKRYRAVSGVFGERLQNAIEISDGEGVFRLTGSERCPFLNERGLCDIYLTLGEDALCQICTDHPRFRNFFSDRTEVGLGLCCAEAARQTLSSPEPFSLCVLSADEVPRAPTPEEAAFFALRQKMFDAIQAKNIPFQMRMQNVLSAVGARLPEKDFAAWARFYTNLERLDTAWDTVLSAPQSAPQTDCFCFPDKESALFFENLLCYFVYRHLAGALEDGRFCARAAFAVHATQFISALCAANALKNQKFHLETALDIVRQYSTEIEYSDENLEAILSALK